jgi:hypothetical protein
MMALMRSFRALRAPVISTVPVTFEPVCCMIILMGPLPGVGGE